MWKSLFLELAKNWAYQRFIALAENQSYHWPTMIGFPLGLNTLSSGLPNRKSQLPPLSNTSNPPFSNTGSFFLFLLLKPAFLCFQSTAWHLLIAHILTEYTSMMLNCNLSITMGASGFCGGAVTHLMPLHVAPFHAKAFPSQVWHILRVIWLPFMQTTLLHFLTGQIFSLL